MTLSLDRKRLLTAGGAALFLHVGLFVLIDYYAPRLAYKAEQPIVMEMNLSLELPVEAAAPEPFLPEQTSPPEAEAVVPEPTPSEDPPQKEPEPPEAVAVPLPEPPIEPVSGQLEEPVPEPESTEKPDLEPTSAKAPAAEPAEDPPLDPEIPQSPAELPEVPPQESLPAGEPGSSADSVGNPAPVTFKTLSAGRRLTAPSYPSQARRFKLEGTVKVTIRVSAEGKILSVELYESSGHGILDREVLSTIEENWSFNPPGRPVALRKNFSFRLQ